MDLLYVLSIVGTIALIIGAVGALVLGSMSHGRTPQPARQVRDRGLGGSITAGLR
ncbi:MAG TPA: hypothetical protein VGM93_11885 [Acidimicrobiales bacterium]|jgi:hypothetical protein